jgi:sensor histidine kinase regulating citrate/malate metabolism
MHDPGRSLVLAVSVCFNMVLLVMVCCIIRKRKTANSELFLAQVIIASGIDYYKRLDQMLQEIRLLRHDYKYHIEVIRELAKISGVKYIKRFLETVTDAYTQTEPPVYCENLVVSILLAHYAERYAKAGISFAVNAVLPAEIPQVDPEIEPLDTYELCIVLGNILENALEATVQVPPAQRQVRLFIQFKEDTLFIEATNTFDGRIMAPEKQRKTAKLPASRKGGAGGYGLTSVMAVCKRHCGEYMPHWTDQEYTVHILLNL